MRKRLVSCLLVVGIFSTLLSGCGDQDTIDALNNMEALSVDSGVSRDYSLSYADEQNAIYAQVSDRQLLDFSNLVRCPDVESDEIISFMNSVDDQLIGKLYVTEYTDPVDRYKSAEFNEDDEVINGFISDYLLTFFQNTPYYWQRTQTIIRGMDSSSRTVVVDVDYKTIGFEKEVEPASVVVRGDPDYDSLSANLVGNWVEILRCRYEGETNTEHYRKKMEHFEKYYGKEEDVLKTQKSESPTTFIYNTGNQKTYTGMVDSPLEQSEATCTVRYVLVPKYVLGVSLGWSCSYAYITDYKLTNDPTDSLEVFTDEGYATVTDSVYNMIMSYFKCLDTADFRGLYKLVNNFGELDKHFDDVFNSTRQKHSGFTVSLFDVIGTHITCGVTISTKERAIGSDITYPIYTDRYYMEVELADDSLKIDNMILVDRKLEGEPTINTEDADTAGFMASIDLTADDRVALEELIRDFSQLQLTGEVKSDEFSKYVDTSLGVNQVEAIREEMSSLSGQQKVVFLQAYQQGSSNYASVRCKEIYQAADNSLIEATAVYEFISKGGKWYIYNYDILSSVRLDSTELQVSGALCLVTPREVVFYNSQVSSNNTNVESEETADISQVIKHKSYTPQLKKDGVVSDGLVKYTAKDVKNKKAFNDIIVIVDSNTTWDSYNEMLDVLLTIDSGLSKYNSTFLNVLADYRSKLESRFSQTELAAVRKKDVKNIDKVIALLNAAKSSELSDAQKVSVTDALKLITALQQLI